MSWRRGGKPKSGDPQEVLPSGSGEELRGDPEEVLRAARLALTGLRSVLADLRVHLDDLETEVHRNSDVEEGLGDV